MAFNHDSIGCGLIPDEPICRAQGISFPVAGSANEGDIV